MKNLSEIAVLLNHAAQESPTTSALFFKTGPGDYAEHDRFIGVSVPTLRQIAKKYPTLCEKELTTLLTSAINEERLLALIILVKQYQTGTDETKERCYLFYLRHLSQVNNWNLVDASAHLILGAHLFDKDRELLETLATSTRLWERRIAIVSTWYFIRNQDLAWTFKLAKILLKDPHDLIHKAVGWMLREAGKRDLKALIHFLDQHSPQMPRTLLRYAIEKLPEAQRTHYLGRRTPLAF